MTVRESRTEHDLLGDRLVPADAYYGVHTLRAVENFPITGSPISIYPDLVKPLACIKQAAATANNELGLLDDKRCAPIVAACKELRAGKLHDQFVVDVTQGGAGTSTNMNANEVIANRALELLGHRKGEYQHLHPNEQVNIGQSTNDAYPNLPRWPCWRWHSSVWRYRAAGADVAGTSSPGRGATCGASSRCPGRYPHAPPARQAGAILGAACVNCNAFLFSGMDPPTNARSTGNWRCYQRRVPLPEAVQRGQLGTMAFEEDRAARRDYRTRAYTRCACRECVQTELPAAMALEGA